MKIALVLLLITISLPGLAQDGLNPTFEFSGVDNFWEIVDLLKADRDPTDAQWSRLFTTPGYAELIQREFKQNRLREFISTAYKPSLKEQRLNTIARADKKGGFWKWFVNSYYQAFDYSDINRSKIIAKRNSFNTFPYTDKAVSELLKFLPETEVSNPPAVSFIIFNDSRGYTPVVMGLNDMVKDEEQLSPQQTKTLKEQGFTKFRPQVLYFAHEFFHHFRDKKLEFKFPEKDNDDSVLLWNINQIENEGIADLINVPPMLALASPEQSKKIDNEQKAQPKAIRDFDLLLAEMHKNPGKIKELNKNIRKIVTRSGHPMGFYMSQKIMKHAGRESLVKVVRNPFKFFYLYNKVCKEHDDGPIFSDNALARIKTLEKKYTIKN